MATVEQLIGTLLLRHNCVIVPSFGGFVAKPVSARIDHAKGTMLPPGKSVLFNRQLINNDGLLIAEYAQANNQSYDEATIVVRDLVKGWSEKMQQGGRIEIEQVGNLFFDDERNICFEQDRFCNLLLESFGLGTVHFLSEEDVQIAEQRISVEEVETEAPAPIISIVADAPIEPVAPEAPKQPQPVEEPVVVERKRKPWRYVAAACILPIAFYSIWIPARTDVLESGVVSIQDFNPFHKQSEGAYQMHELDKNWATDAEVRGELDEELNAVQGTADVYPFKFTDDTYIKVALPKPESEDVSNPSERPVFEPNAMHYVVGCFGDKTNAENLVAKLRANGLDASIVDVKNGLHRVTAGASVSEEAYQTIKLKAEALGFSGWRLQ